MSNVDIATEFANLIVAQRGFEADAKAVTTFDQITQDTIALNSRRRLAALPRSAAPDTFRREPRQFLYVPNEKNRIYAIESLT